MNLSKIYFKLWLIFMDTSFFASKARNKQLSELGVTMEQTGILYAIRVLGNNVTMAEIGYQRGREPSTISETISAMARNGLVTKTRDRSIGNQIRVKLTQKGTEIIEILDKKESIDYLFSPFTESELQILEIMLLKLHSRALELNDLRDQEKRLDLVDSDIKYTNNAQ